MVPNPYEIIANKLLPLQAFDSGFMFVGSAISEYFTGLKFVLFWISYEFDSFQW